MTVLEPPMRKIKPLIVMMAVATSAAIAHAENKMLHRLNRAMAMQNN